MNEQGQVENEEDGFLEADSPDNFILLDKKVEPKTSKKIAYTENI